MQQKVEGSIRKGKKKNCSTKLKNSNRRWCWQKKKKEQKTKNRKNNWQKDFKLTTVNNFFFFSKINYFFYLEWQFFLKKKKLFLKQIYVEHCLDFCFRFFQTSSFFHRLFFPFTVAAFAVFFDLQTKFFFVFFCLALFSWMCICFFVLLAKTQEGDEKMLKMLKWGRGEEWRASGCDRKQYRIR